MHAGMTDEPEIRARNACSLCCVVLSGPALPHSVLSCTLPHPLRCLMCATACLQVDSCLDLGIDARVSASSLSSGALLAALSHDVLQAWCRSKQLAC